MVIATTTFVSFVLMLLSASLAFAAPTPRQMFAAPPYAVGRRQLGGFNLGGVNGTQSISSSSRSHHTTTTHHSHTLHVSSSTRRVQSTHSSAHTSIVKPSSSVPRPTSTSLVTSAHSATSTIAPVTTKSHSTSAKPSKTAAILNVSSAKQTITLTHDSYLNPHNEARAAHGANPLTWSDDLAASAEAWASGCVFKHSGSGENIAAGTGDFTPAKAVTVWMDEAGKYAAGDKSPSHFTQVVWKDTTQVGCAVASCDIFGPGYSKANYYVCHYNSAGNVIGEFSQNVQV